MIFLQYTTQSSTVIDTINMRCRLKKNTFLIKITYFDAMVLLKMSVALKLLKCGSFPENYLVLQSFSRCPSASSLSLIFGSGIEITCYAAIWLQQ